MVDITDDNISIISDDGTASLVEAVDVMLKRRRYFREKKRDQRRRAKVQLNERVTLEAELARLQHDYASHRQHVASKDLSLSWQALAAVFQQETKLACATKRCLEQKLASLKWTIQEMLRLVQPPRPISSPPLHQYACLCADPTSRAMAKQWLAQHMYHNAARAFRDFPAGMTASDEFVHVEVDTSGAGMTISEFGQAVFPYPLHTVVALFKHRMHHVWGLKPQNSVTEFVVNTVLYRTRTAAGEYFNALGAFFPGEDRSLFVLRHIQDDDICPSAGSIQQYSMEWSGASRQLPFTRFGRRLDVQSISETKTVLRVASSMSQPFTSAGFMDVDALAKYWHIPLDDVVISGVHDVDVDAKWEALTSAYIPMHTAAVQTSKERMLAALAQLNVDPVL
ncbi:hypothetical protein H310_09181 [Aphanomyces invadans]|uniref:START domain-containing protein n=1 Tax=Aphanomyces invadans TaxID=157072 RepID=A0A024TWX0_9STRA|nr:hypothetical protein H310_09181 [Aphanomyces invadans]ETV97842.1 hypothetical protein H310_09181 [Aphanomyces invadans]|eukprot:XP_008873403.1 hypothetical protein H310_09181 [Aphanomyces invadans]